MIIKKIKQTIVAGLAVLLLVAANGAIASADNAYGCGTYGAGSYNTNCPPAASSSSSSSSSSSAATTDTTDTTGTGILLNDFIEYGEPVGKVLDLTVNQVIYFNIDISGTSSSTSDVTTEQHSITLKEVGTDYVIITFASTPVDVRINVGQTIQHDVNADNVNDIEVTLNSITNGIANMTFKQFAAESSTPTTTTKKATTPAESSSSWSIWKIVGIVALVLGVIFLIIFLMRRRNDRQQPGPY